jgi:uncharacterized protein YbjT (DUF2867 family)
LIRNPDHVADMRQAGAEAVVCDLEAASAGDVAALLSGAGAVVFAAGAGRGQRRPSQGLVDRAGICRFVQVSSMGAGQPPRPGSDEVRAAYITAKTAAEDDLRARDPDWTILRPGSLADAPAAGRIRLAARRPPLARSPAPTSPRSLPPCSTNWVPGTRRSI